MLAATGGVVLALGFVWFLVEAALHYMGSHSGTTVGWAGRWPESAHEQQDINRRLALAQDRQFRALRRLRPLPVAMIVIGAALVVVGALVA